MALNIKQLKTKKAFMKVKNGFKFFFSIDSKIGNSKIKYHYTEFKLANSKYSLSKNFSTLFNYGDSDEIELILVRFESVSILK